MIDRNNLSSKMLAFYNTLKTRAFTQDDRNHKAEEVKSAALLIRDSLKEFQGNEFVNYYLHCAIHHLPNQIRDCPVDVFDASGCALEHLHKDVKRTLL